MVKPKLSQVTENLLTLFCMLTLVVAFSAQSLVNRNLLTISVFTLVYTWSLLRLKTELSVQYQMSIPLSEPLNASNSITENIMLKRVGQDTSLLNPICDGKGYGAFSIVFRPCMHAVMKLSNDGYEFFEATVFCHDSPKVISADQVKYLGQINISQEEVSVQFLTLLLQLSCSKHHVNSLTFLTEVSLTLCLIHHWNAQPTSLGSCCSLVWAWFHLHSEAEMSWHWWDCRPPSDCCKRFSCHSCQHNLGCHQL